MLLIRYRTVTKKRFWFCIIHFKKEINMAKTEWASRGCNICPEKTAHLTVMFYKNKIVRPQHTV